MGRERLQAAGFSVCSCLFALLLLSLSLPPFLPSQKCHTNQKGPGYRTMCSMKLNEEKGGERNAKRLSVPVPVKAQERERDNREERHGERGEKVVDAAAMPKRNAQKQRHSHKNAW